AAAMNSAPATRASAEFENPVNAIVMARDVPYTTFGSCTAGAVPNKNAIKVVIMMALASYDTASVIHTTTANTSMANMRCPATGSASDIGMNRTTSMAMTPAIKPMGIFALLGGLAGGAAGEAGLTGTATGSDMPFSGNQNRVSNATRAVRG